MDPSLIQSLGQLGLGGIVFVIWYFDGKKVDALQSVIKEQIEEKRMMREERTEFIGVIGRQAALIERAVVLLARVEKRLLGKVDREA